MSLQNVKTCDWDVYSLQGKDWTTSLLFIINQQSFLESGNFNKGLVQELLLKMREGSQENNKLLNWLKRFTKA